MRGGERKEGREGGGEREGGRGRERERRGEGERGDSHCPSCCRSAWHSKCCPLAWQPCTPEV